MARTWTESQLDAITAKGGSVIVSAAAGSGKTTVLVERVIRMITDPESGVSADRLLVVTYTRKAAAELRDRLKKALSDRLRIDPSNTFLLKQQSLLSKAQISTVDAYCMALCRQYFYELDIDKGCRIADEGELSVLRADAMRLTLDSLYTEGDEKFYRLVETFATARSDLKLEDNILKLYNFLRSHPFPKHWMEEKLSYYTDFTDVSDSVWGKIIGEYTKEAADYLRTLYERGLDCIEQEEELYNKLLPLYEGDRVFLEKLSQAAESGTWNSIREAVGSFQKGVFRAPKGYADNPFKLSAAASRDVFKKTVDTLSKLYAQDASMCLYDIERLKDYAEQIFRAVNIFEDNFSILKKEHGVADYSDIEHWVLKLLINSETLQPTELAGEISKSYDCIMVDEYQDANEVQDTIFKTISANETNLFVVGDVKQSIYGFRQAMPELFLKRKNNAVKYDRENPVFPTKVILDRNFRSDSAVLSAVNFFFSRLMSPAVGDIEYNEEERLTPGAEYKAQPQPAVELDILDKESMGEEDAAVAEARFIAERIHTMVAEGYEVKDGDGYRKAVFSDFAVLMRNLSSYGAVYQEVFRSYGLAAHSDSSKGFLGTREVMLMTNFLRVINNPALDIELLSVLLSPVFGFDEDDLARIRIAKRRGSLYSAVTLDAKNGNEKSNKFLSELSYYRNLSVTLPMYRLISAVYERSSFISLLSACDDTGAAANNLRMLLDYARSFEQNTKRGLSSFVAYLDRMTEDGSDLPSAAESNADGGVELMTVHSSKGLEFPVCFIANTARRFVSDTAKPVLLHSRYGYAQKLFDSALSASFNTMPRTALSVEISRDEMSEELRILYVAMTRAKQKLIMTAAPSSKADKFIANIAKKLAGQNSISPFVVRSAASIAEWMTMCALLHPDSKPLRDYAGVETDYDSTSDFRMDCRVISEPFDVEASSEQAAEDIIPEPNIEVLEKLKTYVDFTYPYEGLSTLPVKVAASALAHKEVEAKYDRHLSRPAFLSNEKLTAAEKGTALHEFMQFADFAAAKEDIEKELDRLKAEGYLSTPQAESINLEKARGFINSSLVSRCLKSDTVYKEYRFNIKLPAFRVKPDIEPEFRDEEIILQGAVDLAFVEDGKLVIVDYKTDRVKDPSRLAEMYKAQLMLYKEALSECLGLPVKECIIYSIYQINEIKLD